MALTPNQRGFLNRHVLSAANAVDLEDVPPADVESPAEPQVERPDSGRAAFEAAIRHIQDLCSEIESGDSDWLVKNQRLIKTLADCCRVVEGYVGRASELPDFDEIEGRARDATDQARHSQQSLEVAGFDILVQDPLGRTSQIRKVSRGLGVLDLIARIEIACGMPFDVDEHYLIGPGGKPLNLSRRGLTLGDYDFQPGVTVGWRGRMPGGIGEAPPPEEGVSVEGDTSIHEDQVTARLWDEEGPHDFDLPIQDLVSDGRPWSDIVDKLEAVRGDRTFPLDVDELDDLGIYRLIVERPDLKEDVWKWSGLRRRIFGILLVLPRDELRKASDFTLSDREFLAFARSSDDARERLSQDCKMRLFALENPNSEEEPNTEEEPNPDP